MQEEMRIPRWDALLFVSFENHAIVAWFRKAYSYEKTS